MQVTSTKKEQKKKKEKTTYSTQTRTIKQKEKKKREKGRRKKNHCLMSPLIYKKRKDCEKGFTAHPSVTTTTTIKRDFGIPT